MAGGWILGAMMLLSLLLEPPLFVAADRYPRKWFVCGGLLAMGLVCLAAAVAPIYAVLLGVLALFGPASGCGVTLAQATLMDAHPESRERIMTRWTFMGATGDLAAPLLFSLLALVTLGWRSAFGLVGVALLVYALGLWRRPFPDEAEEDEDLAERVPLGVAVRTAFSNRTLLAWLFGVWLCGMLDEILVAFGALHLRHGLGADVQVRSLILGLLMAGGMVGLLVGDRLLGRVQPLPLLRWSAVGTIGAYLGWVYAPSVPASAVLFFLPGLFSSLLYPIAKAQAYRALPGQSGMVNAVAQVFAPLSVVLPFALGVIADRLGLEWALVVLAAQPVGLLLLSLRFAYPRSRE
jgi:DHA1 family bicyclomycin/chloramphenicol resistance-like MFS transporter